MRHNQETHDPFGLHEAAEADAQELDETVAELKYKFEKNTKLKEKFFERADEYIASSKKRCEKIDRFCERIDDLGTGLANLRKKSGQTHQDLESIDERMQRLQALVDNDDSDDEMESSPAPKVSIVIPVDAENPHRLFTSSPVNIGTPLSGGVAANLRKF